MKKICESISLKGQWLDKSVSNKHMDGGDALGFTYETLSYLKFSYLPFKSYYDYWKIHHHYLKV
jgi:hypothetical protein